MIAASEPFEFIPRGRLTVEKHPGPIEPSQENGSIPENILLQRMQNVNISAKDEPSETWVIREIRKELKEDKKCLKDKLTNKGKDARKKSAPSENKKSETDEKPAICFNEATPGKENYLTVNSLNIEEELYVKKYTAVWTRGIAQDNFVLPHMSFTCDTPIKFAFFCNNSFVWGKKSPEKVAKRITVSHDVPTCICFIDQTSLRVYCSNGEDFLTNLEFPVSNVWNTSHGLLLEKEASISTIQHHTVQMPRLYSLSHPLDEICPVLIKSPTNVISYLVETDYNILYATDQTNLVLLYDNKFGKHLISKLRKASEDEVNYISSQNETAMGGTGTGNMSHSSMKFSGTVPKNSTAYPGRMSLGNVSCNTPLSKLFTAAHSMGSHSHASSHHPSTSASPLLHLQSTIAQHSIISIYDMRNFAQNQPARPIMPELCLEHIWTENTYGSNREFGDKAKTAFIHSDLVGQIFFCYLLPRSCRLQMVRLFDCEDHLQISSITTNIPAKDAVELPHMKMIAVLDPSGSLVLYTGNVLFSKVHIPSPMQQAPSPMPVTRVTVTPPQPGTSAQTTAKGHADPMFPRRSSLLPQKQADITFGDELHMLSPVHPLQPQFPARGFSNVCLGLRDPAGNRITLCYPSNKMYRLSLPLINESAYVSKCIAALRQVLSQDIYLQVLTRWYGVRNPPGSRDYSHVREWEVFKNMLLDLLGCGAANFDSNLNSSNSFSAEEPKKRRKNDEVPCGSDEDFALTLKILAKHNKHQMLRSICADSSEDYIKAIKAAATETGASSKLAEVDRIALLFTLMPVVFLTLHLLYEDCKLSGNSTEFMDFLVTLLYPLAVDMKLQSYVYLYQLDYPQIMHTKRVSIIFTARHGSQMQNKELLQVPAPNVNAQIEYIVSGREVEPYPYIAGVNDLSRNVLQVLSLVMHGLGRSKDWIKPLEFPNAVAHNFPQPAKRFISASASRVEQVIQMMINMGMDRKVLESLPVALQLIIGDCLEEARLSPPVGYCSTAYELVLRSELAEHAKLVEPARTQREALDFLRRDDSVITQCRDCGGPTHLSSSGDGMEMTATKLFTLRFPNDTRVIEVRRLLASFAPVPIDIQQAPGTTDHEFIEEQEKQLYALCVRTMALPMGRAMFTLCMSVPNPTDYMPIPRLNLTGREPVKGASIEMQQIEFPANMSLWPTFHNGVASGLRISSKARDCVNSNWIVFNKPKTATDNQNEHAGFLMGLGLNGHLKSLTFMSMYEYLVKCDEMTSIGLLLGISASYRGTMDNTTTKLLSVHVEALLPATALELDIPQNIQVAALMGIGLVYQGTAKRHIAEVLLQEIGRPPGPEMENSVERESYALTAGLTLGMVTLGQGESPAGLRDLQLADTLHYYMVGGNKRPLLGSQKEKYKLPSFQVREGESVNIDVTSPGATLALGLMFFNTNNKAVAEWMDPPNTRYLLDLVRPDLLLLRTIARGLIMWSEVRSDEEWLLSQFPSNLRFDTDRGPMPDEREDIDHEAVTQAYCNIIAGAAFSMGLKYAGSCDKTAFHTLHGTLKRFLAFPGRYVGEYAGRTTIENCLMVILTSLALVFAGSGDLAILRLVRYLRSRIGPHHPQVTYGSHMAIHMSLGMLFVGAGRYTIAKSPEAVAALVCAFFPKYPIHSNDNRYHLQAFRHLWVLAVEPRLFLPRDLDTKELSICKISVLEMGRKKPRHLGMAPCLLPELSKLQKVMVDDPNYWPVSFEKGRNWEQLIKALEGIACIDVKKRNGCLSYIDDPDRLKSLYSQTLTTEQYKCWEIDPNVFEQFSSDHKVITFADTFLHLSDPHTPIEELHNRQILMQLYHNSLIKDKLHVMPLYLQIFRLRQRILSKPASSLDVWQFKIIDTFLKCSQKDEHLLFSKELVSANIEGIRLFMDDVLVDHRQHLMTFVSYGEFKVNCISGLSDLQTQRFVAAIIAYGLQPGIWPAVQPFPPATVNPLSMMYHLRDLKADPSTQHAIIKIVLGPNHEHV